MSAGGAAGGGGAYWAGGAAYCCCSAACCSSWLAQRPACRRDTRFDTAVAVPAMAAVLATPLNSPGMTASFSVRWISACGWTSADWLGRVGGLGRVEGSQHGLDRDSAAGDQLAAGTAQGGRERRGPDVLVDEYAGGAPRLQHGTSLVEVGAVEQSGRGSFEDREVEQAVTIDVGHRQTGDAAVVTPGDEGEVQDADDAPVGEIDQDRERLAGHPAARELHDQVVDRAGLVEVMGHGSTSLADVSLTSVGHPRVRRFRLRHPRRTRTGVAGLRARGRPAPRWARPRALEAAASGVPPQR